MAKATRPKPLEQFSDMLKREKEEELWDRHETTIVARDRHECKLLTDPHKYTCGKTCEY
jgi:hypothetical protein